MAEHDYAVVKTDLATNILNCDHNLSSLIRNSEVNINITLSTEATKQSLIISSLESSFE